MNRKLTFTFFVLSLVVNSFFRSDASAQQKSDDDKFKKAAENEMKLAMPSDEHKRLAQLAGSWKMEVKVHSAPGAKPMVFEGTAENQIVLGGRFLESKTHTTGSMPTETLSIIGFDRRYGRYTYVGYDSQGTYYVTANGKFDTDDVLTMSGEDTYPGLGTEKYDFVLRFAGPDKYSVDVVFKNPEMTGGQKEFKAVEISYTRAQ